MQVYDVNSTSNISFWPVLYAADIPEFTHKSLMGRQGGVANGAFDPLPLVLDDDDERAAVLAHPNSEVLRALLTGGKLHSSSGRCLMKPVFFFGDALTATNDFWEIREEQWVYEADGERFFLPPIPSSF